MSRYYAEDDYRRSTSRPTRGAVRGDDDEDHSVVRHERRRPGDDYHHPHHANLRRYDDDDDNVRVASPPRRPAVQRGPVQRYRRPEDIDGVDDADRFDSPEGNPRNARHPSQSNRRWDPSPARPQQAYRDSNNGLARSAPRHRTSYHDDDEGSDGFDDYEDEGREVVRPSRRHQQRSSRRQAVDADLHSFGSVDAEGDELAERHGRRVTSRADTRGPRRSGGITAPLRSISDNDEDNDMAEDGAVTHRRHHRDVGAPDATLPPALPRYALDPNLDPASREERAVAKELKRALVALRDTQRQTAELLALAKARHQTAAPKNHHRAIEEKKGAGVIERPITLHVIHHHAIGVSTNADGTTRVELSPGRTYDLEMSAAVQDAVVGTVQRSYVTSAAVPTGQVVHHTSLAEDDPHQHHHSSHARYSEYPESTAPPSVYADDTPPAQQHDHHHHRHDGWTDHTRVVYTAQPYDTSSARPPPQQPPQQQQQPQHQPVPPQTYYLSVPPASYAATPVAASASSTTTAPAAAPQPTRQASQSAGATPVAYTASASTPAAGTQRSSTPVAYATPSTVGAGAQRSSTPAAVPVESAPPAQRQPPLTTPRPLPPRTRPSPAATPTNRLATEEIGADDHHAATPTGHRHPPPPPPPGSAHGAPSTGTGAKKMPPPPPPNFANEQRPAAQQRPRDGTPIAVESIPGSQHGSRTGSVSSQQRIAPAPRAGASGEPALVAASTSYSAHQPPPPLIRPVAQ